MTAVVGDLRERELIGRIQQRLPAPPSWLLVGIGDDAAVVEPERNRVEVVSVDCLVDGVHFDRASAPPAAIGHRALAANLSDLAAMGAEPRLAVLSLALPPSLPLDDFDAIVYGLTQLAARHRVHIVGGNLTRTPGPLTIDITVVGTVKRRQALTRGGAQVGDELYVTGTIGAARAGLEILAARRPTTNDERRLIEAYLCPLPRIRVGTLLARNRVAAACMDLSDGLADAVRQVAEASGVGATLDADALPIEPATREWYTAAARDPIAEAVAGGDDYELLAAVRPRFRRRLAAVARRADVPLTRIGVCTADGQIVIERTVDGVIERAPLPAGYEHFRPAGTPSVVPSDFEER